MKYYYIVLLARSQAFLLEQRMKAAGIPCEIAYMPREIMVDLCNMGIKVDSVNLNLAIAVLSRSGLYGWKVFEETLFPDRAVYTCIRAQK